MQRRQEERAKLAALLAENIDEFNPDEKFDTEATEKALGKEKSDKLKAALTRIGGDLSQTGGYKFFTRVGREREFEETWIDGIDWLEGLEGFSLFVGLMVDEETRNGLVECGFVKDMINLNEELPSEVILWFLEHGSVVCLLLMIVAFEKSQTVARAYSEVVISALVYQLCSRLMTEFFT
jgi:hypothetical protein